MIKIKFLRRKKIEKAKKKEHKFCKKKSETKKMRHKTFKCLIIFVLLKKKY